jgi:hypothetical protein
LATFPAFALLLTVLFLETCELSAGNMLITKLAVDGHEEAKLESGAPDSA